MLTLGINCTGKWTNVGLSCCGKILSEKNEELGRKQSEQLPLITEALLKEAGRTLSEIKLAALAVGPGYYTGIRAGIAYGAALAEALAIPAVPLSSLEVFVCNELESAGLFAPFFKARTGLIYAALYRGGEAFKTLLEPQSITTADFIEEIKKYPEAVLVSPDFKTYPELLQTGHKIIDRQTASGGLCALLGERYYSSAVAPREIRGCYLRAPDIGPTH